jgi:hypothetical protein
MEGRENILRTWKITSLLEFEFQSRGKEIYEWKGKDGNTRDHRFITP